MGGRKIKKRIYIPKKMAQTERNKVYEIFRDGLLKVDQQTKLKKTFERIIPAIEAVLANYERKKKFDEIGKSSEYLKPIKLIIQKLGSREDYKTIVAALINYLDRAEKGEKVAEKYKIVPNLQV